MFSPTKKETELNKNQKTKSNQNQQELTNGQQVALIQNGNKQNGDTKRNGKGKRKMAPPNSTNRAEILRFDNKVCWQNGGFWPYWKV